MVVPSQAKGGNQIELTSLTFLSEDSSHCHCLHLEDDSKGLRKRGDGRARLEQLSTQPHDQFRQQQLPHWRVHSHWTQLRAWDCDRPSVFGENFRSCLRAGLLGVLWALVTCAFVHTTIGFFELGNPRPGALLDFLCLYKTCLAGYAAFLPPFFPDTSKMPSYQEATEE